MKSSLIVGLALAAAAAPFTIAQAQQAPKPAAPFKAPKNAFGQPDLTGYWSNTTLTPLSRAAVYGDRAVYTDAEVKTIEGDVARQHAQGAAVVDPTKGAPAAGQEVGGYTTGFLDPGNFIMRVGGQPRTSLLTTPDGRPPQTKAQLAQAASGAGGRGGAAGGPFTQTLLPGAVSGGAIGGLAFRIEEDGTIADLDGGGGGQFRRTDNPEQRALGERCLTSFGRNGAPPMSANGYYNNNYQFVQSKDHVVIVVEMVHDARVIRLNDRKHVPSNIRPWFGDSVGWYEGDTLVVETTNFPRAQAFQGSWENLKTVERFTPVAGKRIRYNFTIEDPTLWEKPWGGEYEFHALGGIIYEYACHEGNYGLENILAGSRQDEQQEAQAAAGRGTQ